MAALVTNNAWGELSVGITNTNTQILLSGGQGDRFPSAVEGVSWFFVTIADAENNIEIVRCTARNGDTLTVSRGEDSTTAREFQAGAKVELRPCAALFNDKVSADKHQSDLDALKRTMTEEDEKIYTRLDEEVKDIKEKYTTTEYVDGKFEDLDTDMGENWASKEFLEENYLPLEGGTLTGALALKTETGKGFTLTGGDIRVIAWEDTEVERVYGGNITADGTITADVFSSASDERLKTDIEDVDAYAAKQLVKAIRPVLFRWKKDGQQDAGVIAQELQRVFPQAVHVREDGYLSVSYNALVPLCLRAIQVLFDEIEEMKKCRES